MREATLADHPISDFLSGVVTFIAIVACIVIAAYAVGVVSGLAVDAFSRGWSLTQ